MNRVFKTFCEKPDSSIANTIETKKCACIIGTNEKKAKEKESRNEMRP